MGSVVLGSNTVSFRVVPKVCNHRVTFIFKGRFICLAIGDEGIAIVRNVEIYAPKA